MYGFIRQTTLHTDSECLLCKQTPCNTISDEISKKVAPIILLFEWRLYNLSKANKRQPRVIVKSQLAQIMRLLSFIAEFSISHFQCAKLQQYIEVFAQWVVFYTK